MKYNFTFIIFSFMDRILEYTTACLCLVHKRKYTNPLTRYIPLVFFCTLWKLIERDQWYGNGEGHVFLFFYVVKRKLSNKVIVFFENVYPKRNDSKTQ